MKKLLLLLVFGLLCLPVWAQIVGNNHYTHISSATNTPISSAPLTQLHSIVVNSSSSGTIVVVDTSKPDCTGGIAITGTSDVTAGEILVFDITTKNGVCVTTGGTVDITVTWK
ncbi:MAG TPA: hypothetical protein VGG46_04105 [Terriglobales bacterium]|jgi:hypothetical protein